MRTMQHNEDGSVVVELTQHELGLIKLVGVEFTQGPYAPHVDDWDTIIPVSREETIQLFETLP